MHPTTLAKNFARIWGSLWIVANCINTWKVLSAIVSIQDPMERFGYVAVQVILVVVIFYSAVRVLTLKPLIRRHLKILMFVSLLPVLAKGIVPLELMAWIFLALVPSMMLLNLFRPSGQTVPAASGQEK